jgi:hypothetical protein
MTKCETLANYIRRLKPILPELIVLYFNLLNTKIEQKKMRIILKPELSKN